MAVTVIWLPLSLWMLLGDVAQLGKPETWFLGLLSGLWVAAILGFVVALPLTFALQPKASPTA
jgi:hypothetical protein